MVLTVTVAGVPHPVRGPVLRSGAQPGDAVYVTGMLGGSLGSGRHFSFEPRLAEAAWLCETLGAGGWGLHAMIDLSDGLGRDAGRVAAASGVRIEIDAGLLPLNPGVGDWRRAAGDGEDYELLFTAAPQVEVPPACPQTGTRVTRIGRVVEGDGAVVVTPERTWDVSELGWEHGEE
jgi:thiamine-monophosphate kinase